jgi:NADPH-dependent glutamate synthase beta subunit-like oxidoreductase
VACRRGEIDQPIAIRALKRMACERFGVETRTSYPALTLRDVAESPLEAATNAALEEIRALIDAVKRPLFSPPSAQAVAIIGSGPAGLACAHDLALLGLRPTIFEMEPVAAGMLYLGVPAYRLPRELITAEVEMIQALGVNIRTRVTVGKDVSLSELRRQFAAVVIAVGAKRSRSLPIEHADASGVIGGVEFLRSVALKEPLPIGSNVVVIGGGSVAYDVARTALRQEEYDVARTALRTSGVERVTLCCLESLEEMMADEVEIREGEEEGIQRLNRVGPHAFHVDAKGRICGVTFKRCLRVFDEARRFSPQFDERELIELAADTILLAIGQQVHLDFIDQARDGIRLTPRGFIDCDPKTMQSCTAPDVFVAGDAATGPALIITAIESGKQVARSVFQRLTGKTLTLDTLERHVPIEGYLRELDYEKLPRVELPTSEPAERRRQLSKPVELSLSEDAAEREGSRCLDCGVNPIFHSERCILCGGCADVCPEVCLKLVPLDAIAADEPLEALLEHHPASDATAIIMDGARCIRCGLCAERCPTNAITMERFCFQSNWAMRAHG